jgi:AcrR family transcriptional regulator
MVKNKLTSRKLQAIETKEKIFRTAIDLFSKKGFENVRIEDICSRIGLSKGAFYTHFASKDQIIIEQFRDIDTYNAREMAGVIARQKTFHDMWTTWSRMYLKYIHNLGKPLVKVAYRSQISLDKKFSFLIDEKRSIYTFMEQVISDGQNRGEVRSDISSKELTRLVVRAYRGIIYDWCLSGSKFDLGTSWKEMDALMLRGIMEAK